MTARAGSAPMRAAGVREVRSGTVSTMLAALITGVAACTEPSGRMTADTPVVDAWTALREYSMARMRSSCACWADSAEDSKR